MSNTSIESDAYREAAGKKSNKYVVPFALLCSLFFCGRWQTTLTIFFCRNFNWLLH